MKELCALRFKKSGLQGTQVEFICGRYKREMTRANRPAWASPRCLSLPWTGQDTKDRCGCGVAASQTPPPSPASGAVPAGDSLVPGPLHVSPSHEYCGLHSHTGQCRRFPCPQEGAYWGEDRENGCHGADDRPRDPAPRAATLRIVGGGRPPPSSAATEPPQPILELRGR